MRVCMRFRLYIDTGLFESAGISDCAVLKGRGRLCTCSTFAVPATLWSSMRVTFQRLNSWTLRSTWNVAGRYLDLPLTSTCSRVRHTHAAICHVDDLYIIYKKQVQCWEWFTVELLLRYQCPLPGLTWFTGYVHPEIWQLATATGCEHQPWNSCTARPDLAMCQIYSCSDNLYMGYLLPFDEDRLSTWLPILRPGQWMVCYIVGPFWHELKT